MIRLARCRSSSSSATSPASIVLPRPTSSASSRFTRGASIARATGSSWYSSTTTPDRSGACRVFTSAEVTADQRTASRKAASRSGGSNPPGVTSGSDPAGRTRAARLNLPDDRQALPVPAVLHRLQHQQGAAVPARRGIAHHPSLAPDLHQASLPGHRVLRRQRHAEPPFLKSLVPEIILHPRHHRQSKAGRLTRHRAAGKASAAWDLVGGPATTRRYAASAPERAYGSGARLRQASRVSRLLALAAVAFRRWFSASTRQDPYRRQRSRAAREGGCGSTRVSPRPPTRPGRPTRGRNQLLRGRRR